MYPSTFPKMFEVVPECQSPDGSVRVDHFEVSESESRMSSLRPLGYVLPGKYARLLIGGSLVMSDTGLERNTNIAAVRKAYGEVLIAGLGLGMILHPILNKPEVTRVTVVEVLQSVIDLISPTLKPHQDSGRLRIVNASIFDWKPDVPKFSTVYFDIWPDICSDNLKEMVLLQRKYARRLMPGGWMGCWSRDLLRGMLKRR